MTKSVDRLASLGPLRRLLLATAIAVSCLPASGRGEELQAVTLSNMGTVGLIDMPSARMAPDGALSFSANYFQNSQHYNLSFQALPWLETTFRYSGLQHFDPDFPVFYDRSFAVKARLWQEGDVLPSVAIGINDLVGTGVYSGEYLVASKQVGPVDVSLGMGWGRLASANTVRNPLALVFHSFDNRINDATGVGQFAFSQYFHGHNVGLFGGAEWHTPVENLSLSVEYSSDAYTSEAARGNFSPKSQFNLGAHYRAFDALTFGLSWLYGKAVGLSVAIQVDPTKDAFPTRIGPDLPPVAIRTDEQQQAALQTMTGHTSSLRRPAAVQTGALVDALWSKISGVQNVSLQGRTLLVATASGGEASCAAVAGLAAAARAGIDTVIVQHAGARPQRCAISERPALELARFDQPGETHLVALADVRPADLQTINAAAADARPVNAIAAIKADLAKQHITQEGLSLAGSEAILYYANDQYFHERDAVDRIVRVLMADAPGEIESFRIIAAPGSQPQTEFHVLRGPAERNISLTGGYDLLGEANSVGPAPLDNPVLAREQRKIYPAFSWSIFPQFRQQLFDPSNPFAVQFLAGLEGTVALTSKLSVSAEFEADLYDNFNTGRASDSVLPHVRTDFTRFFTEGKNGIGNLEADYNFRLSPTVYGIVRAGYLESMFAGFGGEVLWRPQGARWALGADVYDLRERNFDRLLGLQPYHITTGHISLYYASPWYDLNFVARAGRYLAGDKGLTLEVTRRFETGVEIGVFATKTNVSAQQFGEGSFDKGIFIRIPLNWALPIHTQREFALDLRPVQRDGGQRMLGDAVLYNSTRRSSYAEVLQSVEEAP